jgi:3-methyladenine DNA glycosylase Mpg
VPSDCYTVARRDTHHRIWASYPAGGVLHRGEGPRREILYDASSGPIRLFRHSRYCLSIAARYGKSASGVLIRMVACRSTTRTKVRTGRRHDSATERISTIHSQTFAGLLTDSMGELGKEAHKDAAAAAREEDGDP